VVLRRADRAAGRNQDSEERPDAGLHCSQRSSPPLSFSPLPASLHAHSQELEHAGRTAAHIQLPCSPPSSGAARRGCALYLRSQDFGHDDDGVHVLGFLRMWRLAVVATLPTDPPGRPSVCRRPSVYKCWRMPATYCAMILDFSRQHRVLAAYPRRTLGLPRQPSNQATSCANRPFVDRKS
jgi:hypothetical protein